MLKYPSSTLLYTISQTLSAKSNCFWTIHRYFLCLSRAGLLFAGHWCMANKNSILEPLIKENERLRQENKQLQDSVETLNKRINTLEEKLATLKKNSRNSSKPPSSHIVKPPKPQAKEGKRKQGAHRLLDKIRALFKITHDRDSFSAAAFQEALEQAKQKIIHAGTTDVPSVSLLRSCLCIM